MLVHFFAGAWGEYEWECVELAMRYLYLDEASRLTAPTAAQVVWNFPGAALSRSPTARAGQAPQPGDVLSAGSTSTFGHSMLVAASCVDGSGNGTIDVVEQNASLKGQRTDVVTAWQVQDSPAISGWLHNPAGGSGQVCTGARVADPWPHGAAGRHGASRAGRRSRARQHALRARLSAAPARPVTTDRAAHRFPRPTYAGGP